MNNLFRKGEGNAKNKRLRKGPKVKKKALDKKGEIDFN